LASGLFAAIALTPRGAGAWGELIPGSRYTNARAAALGQAYIPLADDGAAALFYNPAALGKLAATHFEPLNFQVGTNMDFFSVIDRNVMSFSNLAAWQPSVGARTPKQPGVSGLIFPNFAFRGFGIGILAEANYWATSSNGTDMRYRTMVRLIPAAGFGLRLASGVIKIGYAIHWINQSFGDQTVANAIGNTTMSYLDNLYQGSGLSHNAGLSIAFPMQYLPQIHVVGRNILGVRYGSSSILPVARSTAGAPPAESMSIDAALMFSPKMGSGTTINLIVEERDLTNTSQTGLLNRFATGLEFNFRDQFMLRAGWSNLLLSLGLGMKRKKSEFSVAYFSEVIGTNASNFTETKFLLHYQIRAF